MTGRPEGTLRAAVCSEKGHPPKNEDNFFLNGGFKPLELAAQPVLAECPPAGQGVFAVCDGMGGAAFGEVAALRAVSLLAEEAPALLRTPSEPETAEQLLARISASIRREADRRRAPMGAALVLAVISGESLDIYNVGDSRAYLFWQGQLLQLSQDHTLERNMREMGLDGSRAAVRHKLTQYLGMDEEEFVLEPYHCRTGLPVGAKLLLCSDGLTDMVPEPALAECLGREKAPGVLAEALVRMALEAGGRDNVTALVAERTEEVAVDA